MKTETRQYKDVAGNPVTLDWLVKNEPEWAANQIRHRDKLEAELAETKTLLAYKNDTANTFMGQIKKLQASAHELALYLDEYNKQAGESHEPLYWIACRALDRYKAIGGGVEPANAEICHSRKEPTI